MSYLLRLILPDRPGSLGAVATAIGTAGADIVSVDIVDRFDDMVVDDVVIELSNGQLPDQVMSAAVALEGVRVESIRPFDGALSTHRELQLIESMSVDPARTGHLMVEELPRIFRSGWALIVRNDGTVVLRGDSAPEDDHVETWRHPQDARIIDPAVDQIDLSWLALDASLMAVPANEEYCYIIGRPGGPDFRPSELSRLAHLVGISRTIWGRHEQGLPPG